MSQGYGHLASRWCSQLHHAMVPVGCVRICGVTRERTRRQSASRRTRTKRQPSCVHMCKRGHRTHCGICTIATASATSWRHHRRPRLRTGCAQHHASALARLVSLVGLAGRLGFVSVRKRRGPHGDSSSSNNCGRPDCQPCRGAPSLADHGDHHSYSCGQTTDRSHRPRLPTDQQRKHPETDGIAAAHSLVLVHYAGSGTARADTINACSVRWRLWAARSAHGRSPRQSVTSCADNGE